jgi:hypothetical protein
VLRPLLPLRKQRQPGRQHGGSSGSSSSRAVAAAAYYFELPRSFTASGIKFPFLIRPYLSEEMILGTKMLLSRLSYIRTYYDASNILGGVGVTPGETKYLQNVTQIPPE